MKVKSPLTGSENVAYCYSIDVSEIQKNYKKILPQIQTDYIFGNHDKVKVYRCKDTEYEFYWPLNLGGDAVYYDKLGQLPWYYSPWKWEHAAAAKQIKKESKVLEVGAAKGDFLKRIKADLNADVVGLELNPNVKEYSLLNEVTLLNESIEDYAKKHSGEFDVVCSFQVLEHISDVHSFIKSMIECLKPGGKLIISVPNNDTFYRENRLPSKILNMPPHHLGLWTEKSLKNLSQIFEISFIDKDLEPLQEASYETYVMHKFYQFFRSDFLVKVLWKVGVTKWFKPILLKNKAAIVGHSINVYFEKKA
jgi:2-polyprenyl-3-methyl-5-hydroxy-6-metoxy-1,4-benzoquinol methylase